MRLTNSEEDVQSSDQHSSQDLIIIQEIDFRADEAITRSSTPAFALQEGQTPASLAAKAGHEETAALFGMAGGPAGTHLHVSRQASNLSRSSQKPEWTLIGLVLCRLQGTDMYYWIAGHGMRLEWSTARYSTDIRVCVFPRRRGVATLHSFDLNCRAMS